MKFFNIFLFIIIAILIFYTRIFVSGLITPEILSYISYIAYKNSLYLVLPGLATSLIVGLALGIPFGFWAAHKSAYAGLAVPSLVVAGYVAKSPLFMVENIYFWADQILFVFVFFFLFKFGRSAKKNWR